MADALRIPLRLPDRPQSVHPWAMVGQPMLSPPVETLKKVTPYPKARATFDEVTLRQLVPAGVPVVLHLYTG